MHEDQPPLCKGRGTAQRLSETLKIQAVGAGFLAKSNLCSSEAELEGVNHGAKLTFVIREKFMATKQETVGAQEESTLPPSAFLWFFRFTRKERTPLSRPSPTPSLIAPHRPQSIANADLFRALP